MVSLMRHLRGKFPISESYIQLYTVRNVSIKSYYCSKNSMSIFIINLCREGVRGYGMGARG